MNYYQLEPNPGSKKWKGYENPDFYLWNDCEELTLSYLYKLNKKWSFEFLEYRTIKEGRMPPVHSIGAKFVIFNADIQKIKSIELPCLQLVPIMNKSSLRKYYLLNVYKQVDCVDWEKSEIVRWPDGEKIEEWQNKRGRVFINPVLIKDKIPIDLDAFKLQEWGGAFNIIISERLKEIICGLDFDKSFLSFKMQET